MYHAISSRRLGLCKQEAPPRWAVVAVKCCIAGILLLPLSTLLWVLTSEEREVANRAPLAFLIVLGLAAAMTACVTYLTGRYPPVPPTERR